MDIALFCSNKMAIQSFIWQILMPTHAHQNPLWVLAYDDYPMTSVFAKEKWLNEGLQNNYWFSFYHDAFYRLVKWSQDGKEIVDAVKRTR